jgi:hypothetical protein
MDVITSEDGERLKRLYREHATAKEAEKAALQQFGMESREFAQADAKTNELWRRIRELDGTVGRHWMA